MLGGDLGIREKPIDRAASMPHRSFAGDNRLDARLESEFGRLFYSDQITRREYDAGMRYAEIMLSYLGSTDAPEPYGAEYLWNIADDECFRRKMLVASAKTILRQLEPQCGRILDRVVVYEHGLGRGELPLLRLALRALCGEGANEAKAS